MFLLMPYGSNAINTFIHVVNMPYGEGGGTFHIPDIAIHFILYLR